MVRGMGDRSVAGWHLSCAIGELLLAFDVQLIQRPDTLEKQGTRAVAGAGATVMLLDGKHIGEQLIWGYS